MKKAILLFSLVMVMVWQAFSQNAPISTIGNVNSNLAAPEVPITVQNFTNITDCQLRILYDPAVINATGVAPGPGLPGTLYANVSGSGVIVITWFNWPPVNLPDHSTIFRLQFTKVATGSSSLTFEDNGYSCYWGDGDYQILNDVPSSTYYISGSLRVGYAPVTTAPAITACPGQTISVPVTVTDFDNIGRVYGLRMTYNSTVLSYNGYTNTSGFTGLTVANSVSGGTGTITAGPSSQIAGTSGITYADNSVLFTLSFTYNGGTSNLTWQDPASPGTQCLYMGPAPTYTWLTDTPTSSFYIDGLVEPLVAPSIIKDPDAAAVCITTPVSATFGSGSGGVSAVDNYESSIDGGSSWQSYTPGSPLTASAAGNAQIRIRAWRTSVGTACTNSGFVTASWDVVAESAGGTLSGGTAYCAGPNSTVLSLTGYNGTISSWQYSEDVSSWSDIAHTADTYTAVNLLTTTHYRVVVQNSICNPEYSGVETITINPILPVSVTIETGQNPVCAGEEVLFTATPVNGGANPQYQWYLNGSPVSGVSNATYAYIPANGDAITCELTSDETCTSGNPALSNQVVMTVNSLPVVNSATLRYALDPIGPWSPVSGTLAGGYTMCIDPAVANYYLDIDLFDMTPALLPGNLNGFSLDIDNLPPTWWSYWSARGVNGPSGNQYPWQDQMWQIINGNAPIFYIYQTGGDDQLIDGLTWQISGQYTPLRLPGDYPQWNYTYSGTVTDVNSCISSFFDVFLEVNTIPVMTEAELTYSLSPAGPWEPLSGDLSAGYSICINPEVAYYYLDLATVTVSQALLDGHLNPFIVRQDNLPPTWLSYWAGKGVNGPSGNQYPWQDQMWQIINGNAPIFYIYETAGDPQLIDGLTYQMGGGITPLRISGNYPQWNYSYNGNITDENYCISSFFDVFMEINTIPGVDPITGQAYCNGETTSEVILTSDVPGTTFTWENSNTAIGLAAGGTGNVPSFTATNPGSTAITGTITVTPESNGCIGSPVSLFDFTINPTITVSVTIAADANDVCAGTAVQFTATPVNGGVNPAYQWTVNNIEVVGATNATYTYSPVDDDEVRCVMTSDETLCVEGNPATSDPVVMIVNPLLPVSVTIEADGDPVCAGTTVTYTATPTNGGLTPSYQWFVNSVEMTGFTTHTYAYVPANGDQVYCLLTSSETCQSGGPATSNTLTATVNPLLPVSVSIEADQDDVCAGTTVTFTATPVNGGMTPGYQWFVNSVEKTGFNTDTYSYVPENGDQVYCILTSSETCQSGGPATSNTLTAKINSLLPVSVTIEADQDDVCAGTTVTFTATPVNGGSAPTYQWFVNLVEMTGFNTDTYSYVPEDDDQVYCILTSSETCQSGGPATSNTLTATINPLLPVSVTIEADQDDVCAGTTVTFTATPVNGGSAPTYQWFVNLVEMTGFNADTYSYVPEDDDQVYCILTSSETCQSGGPATSNTLTATINPLLPVSVTIEADQNDVCAGTTVTFTATPVNGGMTPGYQWFVNSVEKAGFNTDTYSYVPANGDQVYCILTSSETCQSGSPATSNFITMVVHPMLTAGVSIDADANPVYEGTLVTFTASPVNGGLVPTFQWQVNSLDVPGATGSTYSYVPLNNDQVSCMMTSSESCVQENPVISNTVTMVVDPNVPVSVTIEVDANPVCAGASVTFTATPVNGGSEPVYEWKVNNSLVSGATTATYSYVPSNGDAVVCVLTSSLEHTTGNPATSNTITMTVNPLLPVMVVIGADDNPVCEGTTVTCTAIAINGGTSPSYIWKVNGTDIPGATSSVFPYVPVNGDIITCQMTSNETCVSGNPATSNPVIMTVNSLNPVSVTIAADANPVCEGATVQFTATPVNGGSMPLYQWFVNLNPVSGATNAQFSYMPVDQDAVTCTLTSNLACTSGNPATSNTVIMEVEPLLPVSVIIAADANPVCTGTTVTLTATPVNGGDSPIYQWYVNSSPVSGATGSVYSFIPAAGDAVHCLLTSSSNCTSGNPATSNTITVSLKPLPVPVITGTNATCQGSSNLIYMTDMGMSNYTWTISEGGTITLNAGYLIVVTWHTGGAQWLKVNYTNTSGCQAANPTQYNVTVNPKPVPTLSGAVSVCQGQTGVVYTTEAGMTNYVWNVSGGGINTGGGTSSSNSMTVTWNGAGAQWVSVSYSSAAGCAAAAPTVLNVTVDVPVTPQVTIVASENPVGAGTLVTFTASPVNGGALPVYEWKVNGNVIPGESGATYSYIPLNNDEVTCTMTSDLICVTVNPATSNTITMTVTGIEENITVQNVTIANGQAECYNALQTITVAGTPTTFLVESGGSATFIAGQAIYFLPGTTVHAGGYLLGTIAPDGPFCNGYEPPMPAVIAGKDEPLTIEQVGRFAVYPNPTSGNFTLFVKGEAPLTGFELEVFTMSGGKLLRLSNTGLPTEIGFEDYPAGIYFVRVVSGGMAQTLKLVKTR